MGSKSKPSNGCSANFSCASIADANAMEGIMGLLARSYLRDISEIQRDVANIRDRQSTLNDLQEEAANLFAKRNGWRLLQTTFRVTDIGGARTGFVDPHDARLLDHGLYFRKDRACCAIAAQVYDPDSNLPKIESLALGLGLTVAYPPNPFASIHNPGACVFAVVVEPDKTVKWLHDQMMGRN